WSPGAVKGHLQRGRQRLQYRLTRRGIGLSAALAIATPSRGEAAPSLLLRGTVAAALSGSIRSSAAALARGVLRAMFLSKLAGMTALVLSVALVASAAVALVYRGPGEEREDKFRSVSSAPKQDDLGKPQARTDALGDPLPPGAIARLGTVRFRHGGAITFL